MIGAQAIGQLLEAAIDSEELVRTSALGSLRAISSVEDKSTSTLRAALAFLKANNASSGKNVKEKTNILKKRVHILRAIATIGEVGSSRISPDLAHDVSRMAVEELLGSSEKILGWELCATHVLVSLCPLHMNLVLVELVDRMKPGNPPNMSILYALESIASRSSEAFVGGMARVTSRVVPMLGSITNWKLQVQVAASFSAFCDAVNTTNKNKNIKDIPSDISAAVNSVCDIFLSTWLSSNKSQVRGITGRALGTMINILNEDRRLSISNDLIMKLIDLLKQEELSSESRVDLAMGLYSVMDSKNVVTSLNGQLLNQIIIKLFPLVAVSPDYSKPNFNRARSELLRCIEIITMHHPRPMIEHIISNMTNSSTGNPTKQTGAISVMTHLINAQSDSIDSSSMKETVLSGTIRIINSKNIDVRASIAQLIVALGTANFLTRDSGRELILFVVRQCRVTKNDVDLFNKNNNTGWFSNNGSSSGVTPKQLGKASERFVSALGQCATASVWPLLFTTLTDPNYGGQSIDAVCRCLVDVATGKSAGGEEIGDSGSRNEVKVDQSIQQYKPGQSVNFDTNPDLPSSSEIFARLLVTSLYSTEKIRTNAAAESARKKKKIKKSKQEEKEEDELSVIEIPSSLLLLCTTSHMIHPGVGKIWNTDILHIISNGGSSNNNTTYFKHLPNVFELFRNTGKLIIPKDSVWWTSVGNAISELIVTLFQSNSALKAVCYRCLGAVTSMVTSSDLPRRWTANMLHSVNHTDDIQRYGLASGFEAAAQPPDIGAPSRHIDILLQSLATILRDECVVVKSGWFGNSDSDRSLEQVQLTKSTLLLCWGHISKGTFKFILTQ
jgi:hypothetical protein